MISKSDRKKHWVKNMGLSLQTYKNLQDNFVFKFFIWNLSNNQGKTILTNNIIKRLKNEVHKAK